jgi:hypothetical protein
MLNLIGLVLNVLGTIIAGVSARRVSVCIHTALMAHQVTLEAYFSQQRGIPLFTGLDATREREMKSANRALYCGLFLVVVGFVLQAVAAAAPCLNK